MEWGLLKTCFLVTCCWQNRYLVTFATIMVVVDYAKAMMMPSFQQGSRVALSCRSNDKGTLFDNIVNSFNNILYTLPTLALVGSPVVVESHLSQSIRVSVELRKLNNIDHYTVG